jgi:hypothetical protein
LLSKINIEGPNIGVDIGVRLHNRSLQQELREILVRTASQPYPDIVRQGAEIRLKLTAKHQSFSDSVELLREDRDR